jgi:nucleoside-diphosphate-sugar epimerase
MILVTGGTGFVGSHLLFHLSLEHNKIRATYRKQCDLALVKKVFTYYSDQSEALFQAIEWVKADITDITELDFAFEGVSEVYHCAAAVSFDQKDYSLMRKVNIEGTGNIVNLCILKSVNKICFVSSIATLEMINPVEPITENNIWTTNKGKSAYALTKRAAEMEVWRACQEGLNCIIVNPGVIIGPGYWNSGTGRIFSKVRRGLAYYPTGKTGFVGVNDVAKAMISLMESSIKNESFILVAENLFFKDLLFEIADCLKTKHPGKKISVAGMDSGWKLAWLRSLLTGKKQELTKDAARAASGIKLYSSDKIQRSLDFKFKPMIPVIQEAGACFLKDHL